MSRTGSDLPMIGLRPAVREHPKKPWGVAAGFVEHNAASDPAGMAGVADLAGHSSKRLAPLCNEDHAAALAGVFGEPVAAIKSVAHADKSRRICSPSNAYLASISANKLATISAIRGSTD